MLVFSSAEITNSSSFKVSFPCAGIQVEDSASFVGAVGIAWEDPAKRTAADGSDPSPTDKPLAPDP
jgi:hypothetical protein